MADRRAAAIPDDVASAQSALVLGINITADTPFPTADLFRGQRLTVGRSSTVAIALARAVCVRGVAPARSRITQQNRSCPCRAD